jgi:uncharacterized SAM-binding protein YcdF (DUF218 family)
MSSIVSLYSWGQLKFALQDWFATPERVLIPLATIYVALLLSRSKLSRSKQWKALLLKTIVGLAATYLFVISPPGAALAVEGLNRFLPVDPGQAADAIVVLGRGPFLNDERSQKAAQFWRERRAPIILATGHHEAHHLLALIMAQGVPERALLEEPNARTTEENAVLSAQMLRQRQARRLILITDSPHMLRSLLTFRSLGFDVIPEPIPLPSDLSSIEVSLTALREYVGLMSYASAGRFHARAETNRTSNSL